MIVCFLFVQMTRDNIKNYKGVGKPPFCEITAKAVQSTPPDLSFTVNFGDYIKNVKIKRTAEKSKGQLRDSLLKYIATCGKALA